ncbi:MAG: 2-phosphosulfolactate phosphatase [Limisphaerales bacterium]
MKIDAVLSPLELPALAQRDLRETVCVVFDVLRATSTFVTALHNGAKEIIPVSEISEALAIQKNQPDVLLAGERDGVRISTNGIDFDLGNSPREFTREKIGGKTIVSTTTNGTRALRACAGAKIVLAASFLNLSATAKFLRQNNFENILIICAGTRENKADEDIIAAGSLCEILIRWGETTDEPQVKGDNGSRGRSPHQKEFLELSDSTQIALQAFTQAKSDLAAAISNSENARRLLAIPELRDDVAFCLQRDIFQLVAKMEADGIFRPSS